MKPDQAPPLKSTPPIEAGDFHSLAVADFARNLLADDDAGLGVLHYFVEAVRLGYVPPDAMLHWLADHFARYLDDTHGKVRLDAALGLAPPTPKRGLHDVRTRHDREERTQGYVRRLAILELAGFNAEAALDYLNDGVPGILPPYRPKPRQLDVASLEKYAAEWRGSPLYRDIRQICSESESRGGMPVISQLRAYVKKNDLD